jgi:hypothetical protein
MGVFAPHDAEGLRMALEEREARRRVEPRHLPAADPTSDPAPTPGASGEAA